MINITVKVKSTEGQHIQIELIGASEGQSTNPEYATAMFIVRNLKDEILPKAAALAATNAVIHKSLDDHPGEDPVPILQKVLGLTEEQVRDILPLIEEARMLETLQEQALTNLGVTTKKIPAA
jgi:hypothetical protein